MNENKPRRRANAARAAQKSAYRKSGLSRIVLMVTMMALVAVVSIGGTLAWLQASTDEVVNTFKTSDIELKLEETGATDPENDKIFTKDYQLIPGVNLAKDPKVTVTADIDSYVFVKVIEGNWPDNLKDGEVRKINYEIADGWTELTGIELSANEKVYYRTETAENAKDGEAYYVLKGDTANPNGVVTVSNTITKTEMEGIATAPTLSFKAYAIQTAGFENPADAWAEIGN